MPGDARTLVRLIDELVWTLRREGFDTSPAQAVDVARAIRAVGLEDPWAVREAVAAVIGPPRETRPRFDAAFRDFFSWSSASHRLSLEERLRRAGFTADELTALQEALAGAAHDSPARAAALGRVLAERADLDDAVIRSGFAEWVDAGSSLQLGYLTHRLLRDAGVDAAHRTLAQIREHLVAALGPRGHDVAGALDLAVDETEDGLRSYARRTFEARTLARARRLERGPTAAPFWALDAEQAAAVRRALRAFALRLRAARRTTRRRRARARIDPHRTLRRSLRTGGVPMDLVRKRGARQRPRLVVLCDVSDSVRAVAAFLLELTFALQELFDGTRSFVFVSEIGETTDLFSRAPAAEAVARAWAGAGVVSTADDSNYGHALRAFERCHSRDLDRRTIVVIAGDGRTNGHDAAPDVIDRLRSRSRALYWFCPEPRSRWSVGDSAMPRYAPKCTGVIEVTCADDLERAVRAVTRSAR
ncbi:MAG: VWA domain-containing protein [Polyangiaceae bacterium]|nr:VWA domain-containing protein [Polyangiaceae bacterium]